MRAPRSRAQSRVCSSSRAENVITGAHVPADQLHLHVGAGQAGHGDIEQDAGARRIDDFLEELSAEP
jgi:hypothetical protein